MKSSELLNLFSNLDNRAGHVGKPHLSADQLRQIVLRERIRCDRTGGHFALVIFTVARRDVKDDAVGRLQRMLDQRLRVTDDQAVLDRRRLAVVLPDTSAAGAQRVASEIREKYQQTAKSISVDVFVYSSDVPDDRNDRLDGRTPQDARLPELGMSDFGAAASFPIQPLETIFMQRTLVWKRGLDIVGACLGLALALPMILVAAIAIKLTSRGPMIFAQRRAGLGGQPFTVYKLRTMRTDAESQKAALRAISEQDGPAFKLRNDPRVTRIGRLLRKTSIDELPQFWNVLKGDMSLVGPRPLPCDESDACAPWQRRRLNVKPGLTCIWQVRGRSQVSFAEWVRMDLQYMRQQSLARDLGLILQTVPAVLLRRGAQ